MDFLPYRLFKQSLSLLTVSGDSPEPWQFLFQDPATPIMAGIINLHHDLMFVLNFIAVFVLWMIVRTVVLFDYKQNPVPSLVNKHVILETVWTIIPTLILIGIAIPSFALIYAMDEAMDPELTLKVVGHQWYWSYEFDDILTADNEGLEIESYMIAPDDLIDGELRLLQVDNAIALPFITHIRVLVTSVDVLHCWAVNSLGVKVDAVPGRLNQAALFINRAGMFSGQCSEICGVNHGFMPIIVHSVTQGEFLGWVLGMLKAQ